MSVAVVYQKEACISIALQCSDNRVFMSFDRIAKQNGLTDMSRSIIIPFFCMYL